MVGDRVADVLIEKGGEFAHGYTYSGHPVACAVASVNLSLLQQENLVERTRDETGPYLAAKWRQIAEHPLVGEARSMGLIGALELVRDKATRRFFDTARRGGHDLPRLLLPERPDHAGRARHHDHLAAAGDQPGADRRARREGLALPRPDARALPGRRASLTGRRCAVNSCIRRAGCSVPGS